jgi:hypothetical protein
MTIFLSLLLSVAYGRMKTFLLIGSNVVIGTGDLSIFTSFWNLDQTLFIADCICRRKTTQSLVLWRKETCHLQYKRPFNSSTGGIICDNLILPCLSNSSNIYITFSNIKCELNFLLLCRVRVRADRRFGLSGPNKLSDMWLFRLLGLGWLAIFMSAFCTRRITSDFWCSKQSVLCSRTICEWIKRSGIIPKLLGRVGQCLRPLWWALCDFGLFGVGCRTIWWRAGRSEIVCGWSGRAQSWVDQPFSGDGGDGHPGYESIGIPEYGWGNPFVADVFVTIVLVLNLCDKN